MDWKIIKFDQVNGFLQFCPYRSLESEQYSYKEFLFNWTTTRQNKTKQKQKTLSDHFMLEEPHQDGASEFQQDCKK